MELEEKSQTVDKNMSNWSFNNPELTISFLIGVIIAIFTVIIYLIKIKHLKIEKELSTEKLNSVREEYKLKMQATEMIKTSYSNVAAEISNKLIETPKWLDRYMDEIGASFFPSIFGKRCKHFYFEKKAIAKKVIEELDNLVNENNDTKYYLIIESGTTMFSLFPEIARHLEDEKTRKIWKECVSIITNNLPGAQYLMKNCKGNPSDDDSVMAINCYLMPGIVDSDLVATECKGSIKDIIKSLNVSKGAYKVIGFLTGHHIVPNNKKRQFCPVTREGIHKKIKEQIVVASNEIYLLAPLMQFSFADVGLLNSVYKDIIKKPKDYVPIDIYRKDNPITYITSNRLDRYKYEFKDFSKTLHNKLKEWCGNDRVKITDFKLCGHINHDFSPSELQLEIPEEDLRSPYERGEMNIWDIKLV